MIKVKERYLWFVGMGRLIDSCYTDFMCCENDIVLFNYGIYHNISQTSSNQQVGIQYTIAKRGITG